MTYEEIINNIKKRVFHPIYFLMGEEPFFIDKISDLIEETVLNDIEKEFNQTILYGRDVDIPTIENYAKTVPMLPNYQLVIVREAQNIKNIEDLDSYVKNPISSTILVICYKYKKLDSRKTFSKTVQSKGVVFLSEKIRDNKLTTWIPTYIKEKGFSITPQANILLAEHIGNDLSAISNEIEKIAINIKHGSQITESIIMENTGINKNYNIFELQNAFITNDVLKANRIINYFIENEKDYPLVKILPIIYPFFSKILIYHTLADKSLKNVAAALSINPFFVNDYQTAARKYGMVKLKEVFGILHDFDLRAKGINVSSDSGNIDVLKEMIYKIMH